MGADGATLTIIGIVLAVGVGLATLIMRSTVRQSRVEGRLDERGSVAG